MEHVIMEPGVSVVITTYNRSALLSRAINSALAATAPGDEVLVMDGGSTDNTADVVRAFGDRIRYVSEKCGIAAARNTAIRLAQRPLVAFLDDDDEWAPDKLKLQRAVMRKFPGAVFCFSNLRSQFPNGDVVHDILSLWRKDPRVGWAGSPQHLGESLDPGVPFSSIAALPEGRTDFGVHVGDMYPALMDVLYVYTSGIVVRKELAGAAFRFPEDLMPMEDWECYANLAKVGPAAYLDCELAVQNVHPGSRLTDADEISHGTSRIVLLRRVWGADAGFLRTHAARYEDILKFQYLRRGMRLLSSGRTSLARADLNAAGGPWSYRLLASLPPVLTRNILAVRRIASRVRRRRR